LRNFLKGFVLSTGGLYRPFRRMNLARLAVPHGGAKWTYIQASSWMIRCTNLRHSGFRRSSCKTGAARWLDTTWSTPNESRKPKCRRDAVRRLVPAKISIPKSSCEVLPEHLANSFASKDANGEAFASESHEWAWRLWVFPQPGSAQT